MTSVQRVPFPLYLDLSISLLTDRVGFPAVKNCKLEGFGPWYATESRIPMGAVMEPEVRQREGLRREHLQDVGWIG